MPGRQEHDKKIEQGILKVLKNSYSIVADYYYSLTDKTSETKKQYVNRVIRFLNYIEYNDNPATLAQMKTSDINRYMDYVRYDDEGNERSTSARAGILFAINNFCNYLANEEYIKNNICDKVKPPKISEEKEIVAMTKEDILEVENNIKKWGKEKWKYRDLAIFVLGCTTGLRVSSIIEINISDVDFDNKKVTVTEKGNKIRQCSLGDKTIDYIKKWLSYRKDILGNISTDALFISNHKKRMSTETIRNMLNNYTYTLDKKITPHKMRSTCATNLYQATGDIYLVQDVLGHSNIANTKRYAKMSNEKRQYAADVLNDLI